jgi:hypothetical protein
MKEEEMAKRVRMVSSKPQRRQSRQEAKRYRAGHNLYITMLSSSNTDHTTVTPSPRSKQPPRQAGRQAGRQADRQADRQTGRQVDRETDR